MARRTKRFTEAQLDEAIRLAWVGGVRHGIAYFCESESQEIIRTAIAAPLTRPQAIPLVLADVKARLPQEADATPQRFPLGSVFPLNG